MLAEILQALTEGLCEGMLLATLGCVFSLFRSTSRAFDFATAILYTVGGYAYVLSRTTFNASVLVASCLALTATGVSALLLVTFPSRLYRERQLSSLGIMVASLGIYTFVVRSEE